MHRTQVPDRLGGVAVLRWSPTSQERPVTVSSDAFLPTLLHVFREMEERGLRAFELSAADLYRYAGGDPRPSDRLAACCAALRGAMTAGDEILSEPDGGFGASLRIRYTLPRAASGSGADGHAQNRSSITSGRPGLDTAEIVSAFVQVATLANVRLSPADVWVELHVAPHVRPPNLPDAMQAVYVFMLGEKCLKVGKAGPNSTARYCSQHYSLHAPSTLAKSILGHGRELLPALPPGVPKPTLHAEEIGRWIESYTSRMNVLIPARSGPFALSLLEAFLQCRLKPLFEGPRGLNSVDVARAAAAGRGTWACAQRSAGFERLASAWDE